MEKITPASLVIFVNNILCSTLTNVEVYIQNQQTCISNGRYGLRFHISNNSKGAKTENERFWQRKCWLWRKSSSCGCNLVWSLSQGEKKLLSYSEAWRLFVILAVEFDSIFHLLYPQMKVRLGLTRAKHSFYTVSGKPKQSHGIVDCLLYTRRVALKNVYHQKHYIWLLILPRRKTIGD